MIPEGSEDQNPVIRRKYHTLDGIRGVAALIVLMRLAGDYFGNLGVYISRAESYLAVDLFFVLSGFVISEAYDNRLLGGLSPMEFMKIRFIRLYPLYLLGLLFGTISAIFSIFGNNTVNLTRTGLMKDFVLAFFMLPTPFSSELYPLNGPSWSLFFELIANGLYAGARAFLTTNKMILTILIAAIGLGSIVYRHGNMDLGNEWMGFTAGISRVIYSFGAGLLINRFHTKAPSFRLPSWMLLVFVLILMSITPSAHVRPWYDMLVVFLLFPAIVNIAADSESSSEKVIRAYSLLGTTSYAIYIVHFRLAPLIAGACVRIFKFNVDQFAPFSGLLFLFSLVYGCWLLDNVYDLPVRRWATKTLLKK